MTSSRTALLRLTLPSVAAALLLLAGACGSSNKNTTTASPSASAAPSAARTQAPTAPAIGSPAPGSNPPGSVAIGSATPNAAAIPTPDAAQVAVAQRLQPALLQTSQLPSGESDFQAGQALIATTSQLVAGRSDAKTLQQEYDSAGRLGGIVGGWAKPGGQITPQTTSPYLITCALSQYRDNTAAQQGVALSVQQIRTTPEKNGAIQTTTADLQAANVGSGAAAFRQDQAIQSSLNGQLFTTHVITYEQVWQRGPIVAQCQYGAINEEPSLADFQQIVRTQDADLQQAGF